MKKYLIAGLLVWLPLAITVWVLLWVQGLLDGVFAGMLSATAAVLPNEAKTTIDFLRGIPGLGVVVLVGLLIVTGIAATNIAGQWALRQGHRVLSRTPIV